MRTALEWVALREVPQKIALSRLQAFATAHADWPAAQWVRHEMEAKLIRWPDKIAVERFFETSAPETPLGKLALAKALKATGRGTDATKVARALFRESDLSGYTEGLIRAEFGADLTKGDYKYRADRLLYKEKVAPAMRYAAQAGSDVLALAKARAAVIADVPSDKAIAAVPEALRGFRGSRDPDRPARGRRCARVRAYAGGRSPRAARALTAKRRSSELRRRSARWSRPGRAAARP